MVTGIGVLNTNLPPNLLTWSLDHQSSSIWLKKVRAIHHTSQSITMAHHTYSHSVRMALYRVFVEPARIDLRLQRNQIRIFPIPAAITTCQRRLKTTKKQHLARDDDASESGEAKIKRSYKDRVAEREVGGRA
jgi:hypothetical protein